MWNSIIHGDEKNKKKFYEKNSIPSSERKKQGYSKGKSTKFDNRSNPVSQTKTKRTFFGNKYMSESVHKRNLPDGQWKFSHWTIFKWVGASLFIFWLMF